MKRYHTILSFIGITLFSININAQDPTIPVADNLVAKLPAIPAGIAEDVKPYIDVRGANFATWHPVLKEMLIQTRFGNTTQVHRVKMPGGDRKQLTFFDEAPDAITIQPTTGDYFLYSKDKGGSEFTGLYRYDFATVKARCWPVRHDYKTKA